MRWLALLLVLAITLPVRAQRAALEAVTVGAGDWRVVLLHGYGAPPDDLVPLARQLSSRVHATFVVPGAPLRLPGGGRQWFPIGASAAQVTEARAQVDALIDGLGAPPSHVIVGGFSQGAMLSIVLATAGAHRLGGIFVLSGRELDPPAHSDTRLLGLPIFASHGHADARIPFERGEAFVTRARTSGADVTFVPFEGGHEIPTLVDDALATWLAARVHD